MRSSTAPDPAPAGPALRRPGALLALLAVLLPVAGLLWAGERARDSVVERVEVGQRATAQAVAGQMAHAWLQVVATSRAATSRPGLVSALVRRDTGALRRTLISTAAASPFTALQAYDAQGVPLASAGVPFARPVARQLREEQIGDPVVVGDDSLVDVLEPVGSGGRVVGTLRLQVSLQRLVADPAALRYGRTGTSSVTDSLGRFLLTPDPDLRGRRATSPAARDLAAAHVAGSLRLYSPLSHARIVVSYAPAPGTSLGVFTRQHESEAFLTADRLRRHLRLAAGAALLLGLALLAAGLGLLRSYRTRLQARDEAFRGVVERSRDILSRYDARSRAEFVSPAVADVLGWTPEERLGRSPLDLVHPQDRAGFLQALRRHADRGTVTHTCRLRHRDGHDVWAETTTVVTRGPDGAVTGYDAVTRDVSERHQAQVELAAARDGALDASISKSVFLANTSHELRTPLNGILGLTEVLLGTDLDPEQRECAHAAHASGRTLLTILDDILDLAKIEAGRVQLEQVPFELEAVVERTVSPFRPLAAATGTVLEVELDPGLPAWVVGDPTRFGQVLGNLVSNAVKFTGSGSVRVLLAPSRTGAVEVAVVDTGIGIDRETLGRLFTSFTQAAPSTARTFGGTGLGLAVSRQLAELQGGTLDAVSEEGTGSTFRFVVPLPATAAPDEAGRDDRPAPAARPLRVLVAEDNLVNQLVVRTMLEQLGHAVEVVGDGAAAVRAVLDAGDGPPAYDVVLMDCQMPVLDGYDATRQIRAAGAAGRLPVLGLSASAMTGDRARGLAAGMDDYLTKPIDMKELRAALEAVERPDDLVVPTPRRPAAAGSRA